MDAQIIYAKKISSQEENTLSPQIMKDHFHTAIEINHILAAEHKRAAYFFIDPLLNSFEAANGFYFGILGCDTIKKMNTYKTIGDFFKHHEITVTGGMNLARAPWNNPALNGLIAVTEQLVKGHAQYGVVHGNGGIGEAQGITVLEGFHGYESY